MNRMNRKTLILFAALLAVVACGMFYNLGDRSLWGDEATTALLALNINKFGVPQAFDGKNEITLLPHRGDLSQHKLYVWSPWLAEYVAAGSFALFGKSTVAARLPFAGIAFASVICLAIVAYRLYEDRELALTAVVLLVTCVPFYLLARQCRYYAILFLAQLWMIYGFHQLLQGRRLLGSVNIAFALGAQFYSNYIVIPGNVLGLALAGLLLVRRYRQLMWALPAAFVGFALIAAPWLLYTPPASQFEQLFNWELVGDHLAYCVSEIHFHMLPIPVLLIPAGVALFRCLRRRSMSAASSPHAADLLLWSLLVAQTTVLSVTVPSVFFRYLTPLIPVLMLLGAAILTRYIRAAWARRTLVAVLAFSNVVAIGSGWPFLGPHRLELPLVTFVRSLTTEYTDRLEGSVNYLREQSTPDQTLCVADPEFPLIFYTGLKVIDVRLHRAWPADPPDWILPLSPSAAESPFLLQIPPEYASDYERIVLPVPATPRGANRPDPHAHQFFTAPTQEELLLYRKQSPSR
jgi:4-amino-4-deoxy-L-arabinose transferase-like glycosyltransferase